MRNLAGFTLIEVIVVLVVVGILAALTTKVIVFPVRAYADLQRRNTLVGNAESALLMMQRDIRRALPNSIRITNDGNTLELLHISDGGRYRAYPTSSGSGDILDFSTSDSSFDVIGSLSVSPTGFVVIYNLGNQLANAYTSNNLVTLSENATPTKIIFTSAKQFPQRSPQQRFFIVDTPITYRCDSSTGNLLRYSGYAISITQPDPPSVSGEIQANTVSLCRFSYTSATNTRAGLVTLKLVLTDSSGESATLIHEVHVDNAP